MIFLYFHIGSYRDVEMSRNSAGKLRNFCWRPSYHFLVSLIAFLLELQQKSKSEFFKTDNPKILSFFFGLWCPLKKSNMACLSQLPHLVNDDFAVKGILSLGNLPSEHQRKSPGKYPHVVPVCHDYIIISHSIPVSL